jgi:hypothetical protein
MSLRTIANHWLFRSSFSAGIGDIIADGNTLSHITYTVSSLDQFARLVISGYLG